MAISKKVGEEQRRQMVAEAAYFRAEKRGFGVDPVADWIEAEVEIDARVREIENAHLIEHVEKGLAASTQRVAALKKRLGKAAVDVRTERGADVEAQQAARRAAREGQGSPDGRRAGGTESAPAGREDS